LLLYQFCVILTQNLHRRVKMTHANRFSARISARNTARTSANGSARLSASAKVSASAHIFLQMILHRRIFLHYDLHLCHFFLFSIITPASLHPFTPTPSLPSSVLLARSWTDGEPVSALYHNSTI
jgi:hypothetical protein